MVVAYVSRGHPGDTPPSPLAIERVFLERVPLEHGARSSCAFSLRRGARVVAREPLEDVRRVAWLLEGAPSLRRHAL